MGRPKIHHLEVAAATHPEMTAPIHLPSPIKPLRDCRSRLSALPLLRGRGHRNCGPGMLPDDALARRRLMNPAARIVTRPDLTDSRPPKPLRGTGPYLQRKMRALLLPTRLGTRNRPRRGNSAGLLTADAAGTLSPWCRTRRAGRGFPRPTASPAWRPQRMSGGPSPTTCPSCSARPAARPFHRPFSWPRELTWSPSAGDRTRFSGHLCPRLAAMRMFQRFIGDAVTAVSRCPGTVARCCSFTGHDTAAYCGRVHPLRAAP